MSEDRNFDDFIKGEFKNYSPHVPAHIWENIVAKRDRQKTCWFLAFIAFSGANLIWLIALIIAGATGTFILSHNSTTPFSNQSTTANNINNTSLLLQLIIIILIDIKNKQTISSKVDKMIIIRTVISGTLQKNTSKGSNNKIN